MVRLLDLNVLVALAWPSHIFHDAAHRWFGAHAARGWATCPMTQCGFVRLSSNRAIIPYAVSPKEAVKLLAEMTSHKGHRFWPDDIPFHEVQRHSFRLLLGHRQVTDAYLAALAHRHGGRLATFDKGLAALAASGPLPADIVELLPA
jgi:toxin-antitoxin system PIN domain toxin